MKYKGKGKLKKILIKIATKKRHFLIEMALFLFKDFWEEGEGCHLEFTENGIFKVPTSRWEGQNLDAALLAILLLRSSLKPLHGKIA